MGQPGGIVEGYRVAPANLNERTDRRRITLTLPAEVDRWKSPAMLFFENEDGM
ncbi:MAG: hypothetical protein IPK16_20020 [Anaerolineales bacterium]|nr:hypothetical protein [Anaerolineales bacterium]